MTIWPFRTAPSLAAFLIVCVAGSLAYAQDEVLLEILCSVDDATVSVDGEEVATTPLFDPVELSPGDHLITVSRPGFVSYEEPHVFEEGDIVLLEVDLIPFAGIVRVVSNVPGATVSVDDEVIGTTPFEGEVRIGERDFLVSTTDHEPWTTTMRINAGAHYFLEAELVSLDVETEVIITESTPWYQHWGFWTGTAVVIGGGVAAFLLLSEDEESAPVDILIELPLSFDY